METCWRCQLKRESRYVRNVCQRGVCYASSKRLFFFVLSSRLRWGIGHGQQAQRHGQGFGRVVERVRHKNGNGHGLVSEQLPVQDRLRRRGLDDDDRDDGGRPEAVHHAEERLQRRQPDRPVSRHTVGRPGTGRSALRVGRLPAERRPPPVVQRRRQRLRGPDQLRQIQQRVRKYTYPT